MTINKANYEIYVLDYLEGKLSASESTAMRAFLKDHPLIETEVLELGANWVALQPDLSITFTPKAQLLQPTPVTKVVWYQKKELRRWASAVAAVWLLLLGYGIGYFIAPKPTQQIIVLQRDTIFSPMEAVAQIPVTVTNPPLTKANKIVPSLKNSAQFVTTPAATLAQEESTQAPTRITPFTTLPSKPLLLVDESWVLKVPILSAESTIAQTDKLVRITRWIDYLVERLPFQDASKEAFVPSYFLETGE